MRCYFDLVGPDGFIADDEGVSVTDILHAHRDAIAVVREARAEWERQGTAYEGWRLEARDRHGVGLFTVDFDTASNAHGDRREYIVSESLVIATYLVA